MSQVSRQTTAPKGSGRADASPAADRLAARGVVKRFGGEVALDGVNFELRPGEIHALLGENGAGKSTLIKILAGVVPQDEGDVCVDGTPLPHHHAPADATGAGLAFVHQDLGLAEHLSIAENIGLTIGYRRRGPLIAFRETERMVAGILADLGISLHPRALVGSLAQDEKVMVAVARAFSMSAKAIVLDEISSSLPGPEVERLAASLRASRESGVGYVYVTHRLDEVFAFCDRVTVLRDGRRVATAAVADVDHEQVVRWILGSEAEVVGRAPRVVARDRDVRLRVRALQGPGLAAPIDFDVREGEILALCGLVGCGAREVAALLGGAARPLGGSAELDGEPLPLGDPARLREVRCTYVPGDRQAAGAVLGLNIRENLFLARCGRADPVVRWPPRERIAAAGLAERFDVRPRANVDRSLASLSGGNQQKVIAGRALRGGPRLIVVDDPTAGVDVGSRAQLHRLLRAAADDGTIVVMASTDFDEVAGEADRALVLCNGGVHAELAGERLTADRIATASYGSGASWHPEEIPTP